MNRVFTKEQNEEIYRKANEQLDDLIDDYSEFYHCLSNRRILIDKGLNMPYVKVRARKGYIECTTSKMVDGKTTSVSIGRYLLGITDPSIKVDHINRNPLDNRKSNLRACTHSQNLANRTCYSKKYKYKGLSQKGNTIRVECQKNGVRRKIILYSSNLDYAAKVYDCLSVLTHGKNSLTNFDINLYTPEVIYNTLHPLQNSLEFYVNPSKR